MKVKMKNPDTGNVKEVKIGWSWTLFFFASFFGLPLFLRKLDYLGMVFLVLSIILQVANFSKMIPLFLICWIITGALAIWMAVEGNEMTGKNYLANGWLFADPESESTKFAKGKWGILD